VRALVLTLALGLAGAAYADEAGLQRAFEVLRQMREARAARADAQIAPEVLQKFGHLVKPPPPPPPPPPPGSVDDCADAPALKPTGTISVGGQLRVLIGTESFERGDEVAKGWKVVAITNKQLTIRGGTCNKTYRIP
jgi:hypothetical protein